MFEMPKSIDTPLIMIGPGTGVVPFIGFIEERHKMIEQNKDLKFGPSYLYFGCRRPTTDFIFDDLLRNAVNDETKVLDNLYIAFSRGSEVDPITKNEYV